MKSQCPIKMTSTDTAQIPPGGGTLQTRPIKLLLYNKHALFSSFCPQWESRVTQYERDFDRIGMTVRKEVLRFEKQKAKDFKSQIIRYLEAMLQSQQRLIKFWEAFLPEAKAIA